MPETESDISQSQKSMESNMKSLPHDIRSTSAGASFPQDETTEDMLINVSFVTSFKGAEGGLQIFLIKILFLSIFEDIVIPISTLFTPIKNSKYFFHNQPKREGAFPIF